MATHRFDAVTYHNVLGTAEPALRIESGDTVITETLDAGGFDARGGQPGHRPNPMNGPIYVEDATPGDSLRVEILRMTPAAPTGWTRAALAANVVDPDTVRDLPPRERAPNPFPRARARRGS